VTQGPYLYDEGPVELHTTGTPRRRRGLLFGVLGGTAVVAVGMAVALPLVTGTAAEQSRDAVTVFLAALQAGDTETASQLLCDSEQQRVPAEGIAAAYVHAAPGEVTGTTDGPGSSQQVAVRWADGATSTIDVVNEDGARICGTTPAG
jgi:hypothetical protein